MILTVLRSWARNLKQQIMVVYYAAHDRRTPWSARLIGLLTATYALSPIDLIPDFIPVIGLLDDLILVPIGLALTLRLLPAAVLTDAKQRATASAERPPSRAWVAIIIAIWICCGLYATVLAWRWLDG